MMHGSNDLGGDPVHILLETPITFEVPGRIVHSPMVKAKVHDVETKLILDTGTTDHVFTMELAGIAGLEAIPTDPGTDHTGASVQSWSLGPVSVDLGALSLSLKPVIGIEGPPPFGPWGIGGFLCPQRLHESATVVIDLLENRLFLIECNESFLGRWLTSQFSDLAQQIIERESGEGVRVITSIGGHQVTAMVNSGTSETEVARSVLPGLRGVRAEGEGLGLSGAEVAGVQIRNQVLQVGETQLPIPILFLRDQMPPEHPDGQIGMDLLRGTVLAISPDRARPIHWMVPTPVKL